MDDCGGDGADVGDGGICCPFLQSGDLSRPLTTDALKLRPSEFCNPLSLDPDGRMATTCSTSSYTAPRVKPNFNLWFYLEISSVTEFGENYWDQLMIQIWI